MNTIQEKIYELLLEIDAICRKLNIKYCLNEHLALGAAKFKRFIPNGCSASILMTDEDCERFISFCESNLKEEFGIEYLGNQADFQSFHVKFYNKNTLYFPTLEWESNKHNGICVFIHRLGFISDADTNKRDHEESETLLRKYLSGQLQLEKGKVSSLYRMATSMGEVGPYDEYYVRTPKYITDLSFVPRKIPNSLFSKMKLIEFENYYFPVPEDINQFLTICYVKDWKSKKISGQIPGKTIIANSSVSYSEYFDKIDHEINVNDFLAAREKKAIFDEKNNQIFKGISSYYDIVKDSHKKISEGNTEHSLKELQKKLLAMIKEIDAICKKHDITYYADSGTALGAVRNKGFLPWDDDADLIMTRSNWDKFLSIIDEELPENRELACFERNPDYHSSVCRYVDVSTTRITYSMCLAQFPAGHCIDIFVLDPISDDREEQELYVKNMLAYMEFRSPNFIINDSFDSDLYMQYIKRAEKIGDNQQADKEFRHELFDKYLEEKTSHYIRRWNTRVYIHHKDMFGEPVYFEFEDMKIPVMPGYERLFIDCYGNSWTIVPTKAMQEVHSMVYCSNLKVGYKEYVKAYMPLLDAEDLRKKLIQRKMNQVEGKETERFYRHSLALMQGISTALALESQDLKELLKLLKQKQYRELNERYEPYFQLQCTRAYFDQEIFIPLDDERLYIGIYLLNVRGDFFHADKILSLREKRIEPLTKKLKVLRLVIDDKFQLVDAISYNQHEKASHIIKKWLKKFPDDKYFNKIWLEMELSGENKSNQLKKLQKYAEEKSELTYNSEIFKKLTADILAIRGDTKQAMKIYKEVYENTRDGLIKLQIESIL